MKRALILLMALAVLMLAACSGGTPAEDASAPAPSAPAPIPAVSSAPPASSSSEKADSSSAAATGGELEANYDILGLLGQSDTKAQAYFGAEGETTNVAGGVANGLYFPEQGFLMIRDENGTVHTMRGNIIAAVFNSAAPVSYEQLCSYFSQTPELAPHAGDDGFSTDAATFVGANYNFYVGFTKDAATGQYLSDFGIVTEKA